MINKSSIYQSRLPEGLELQGKKKYAIPCIKCSDSRSKQGTKSLQVYRDDDGFIRWECYHPGCVWNVRHATKDRDQEGSGVQLEEEMQPVLPIPFDPTEDKIVKLLSKQFTRIHWYKDDQGRYLFALLRKKDAQGRKTILPLTLLPTGDWSLKSAPKGKFLYTIRDLKTNPNMPIIVVEGEKAVDDGQPKFPNSILVTWPGGSNSVSRGDWSRINNRQVLIWPDNDEAGKEAALDVGRSIVGNISIAYVANLPSKSDLADDLTQEQINEAISKRMPFSGGDLIRKPLNLDKFYDFLKQDHKGIPTGWDEVDKSIHLRGLTIIEGRSSHGKSTVMFNLADNLLRQNKTVIFYSYEMMAEEVLLRLSMLREKKVFSTVPWENQDLLAKAIIEGRSKGYKEYETLLNKKFFLTDEYLTIDKLIKDLSNPLLNGSVALIDYIQFIPADAKTGVKPRYLQIKDFAEQLKNISKKNNLTIITGSQLTAGDQPAQDVAREGKDIYNAADVVLRIWNRLEGDQTATKWNKEDDSDADGLLLVRKARAGANSRSFDFNFSDTRKMLFGEDRKKVEVNKMLDKFNKNDSILKGDE